MKKNIENSRGHNSHNKYDDKYNINDKYDLAFNSGTTEQTGVVRPQPQNEDELESFNEIFTFKTEDVVVDGTREEKDKEDKHKNYKYK